MMRTMIMITIMRTMIEDCLIGTLLTSTRIERTQNIHHFDTFFPNPNHTYWNGKYWISTAPVSVLDVLSLRSLDHVSSFHWRQREAFSKEVDGKRVNIIGATDLLKADQMMKSLLACRRYGVRWWFNVNIETTNPYKSDHHIHIEEDKEDSLMMFIMMITNIIFNFQSQVTVFPSSTKSEMTFPTEPEMTHSRSAT